MVLAGKDNIRSIAIGMVTDTEAATVAALGHAIAGKTLVLDSSCCRHIDKQHGAGEWRKGQRPVTPAEIAGAAALFRSSRFSAAANHTNSRFAGAARIGGERIETLWAVRGRTVVLFDMWAKR